MLKNLIIAHRGPEYERDFDEISKKIIAKCDDIQVFHLPCYLDVIFPERVWQYPTYTISFHPEIVAPIKRGIIHSCKQIEKLDQTTVFRANNIPTPYDALFKFGMTLDPSLFGEFVITKPADLELTSTGNYVNLIRRESLMKKKKEDYPTEHPINSEKGCIVQDFIDTGDCPSYYRVQTFMGEVIFSYHPIRLNSRCSLDSPDEVIETTHIASQTQGKKKILKLYEDIEVLTLAKKVSAVYPEIPTLAIDIVRDVKSNKLYVLECNPGGNTWHFSSPNGYNIRKHLGNEKLNDPEKIQEISREILKNQFGAFDIISDKLIEATKKWAQ
jgi:hypothetical protein